MFWLGAIVSLCYVPGITGAYIATQWPLLAVIGCFGLLRSGPFTVLHCLGLLFVAYAVALMPFSPTPYASVFGLWLIVIMGLCVWFGTTVTDVRGLYAGLAAGAAVSSAIAVMQHFGLHPVATISAQPDHLPGLYLNGVQQGAVLALIVVALVSERMWLWALPLLPGVALSQSRGAWLALAVGLLACGVRRLWVLGALATAGAFFFLSPLSGSDLHRLLIWHTTWDNLIWQGWGPGVFYSMLIPPSEVSNGIAIYPEYAHNDALQLLFEYGVGAALPFAIMGYALWRTDVKEWPVVLAFVVAGCYSMPLFMPIASFLALVAVGRILRSYGVDGGHGGYSGQHVISWLARYAKAGRQVVPMAPHSTAKG